MDAFRPSPDDPSLSKTVIEPGEGGRPDARSALLDAALGLIRRQGFAATSVDALCRAAGVTKGAFFHHFASKEALGAAAAQHWSEVTGGMFSSAAYHAHEDPLDRVLGYLDLRDALIEGRPEDFSCVAGTMAQEQFAVSEAIRAACAQSIFGHAETLVPDIAKAIAARGITPAGWTAESLAQHIQAVLQGAFILAKARGSAEVARESVAHLRRYVRMLFGREEPHE